MKGAHLFTYIPQMHYGIPPTEAVQKHFFATAELTHEHSLTQLHDHLMPMELSVVPPHEYKCEKQLLALPYLFSISSLFCMQQHTFHWLDFGAILIMDPYQNFLNLSVLVKIRQK